MRNTLQLLLANQHKSLRTLTLRTCPYQGETFRNEVNHVSLETLEVASWGRHRNAMNYASAEMLFQSLQTLKRLRLGFENTLAKIYADGSRGRLLGPTFGQSTAHLLSVVKFVKDNVVGSLARPTALRLEELSLCGMDLNQLAPGVSPINFNFGGLTSLRLESCLNLPQALPQLRSQGERLNANARGLSNLRSFSVRVEDGDNNTMRAIKDFLMIIRPLKTLHFLFEGKDAESITKEVLERHGTSLESLVWDTRSGPRCQIESNESSEWGTDCSTINRCCVNLKALGLSFDWEIGPLLSRGRPTKGPVSFLPIVNCSQADCYS